MKRKIHFSLILNALFVLAYFETNAQTYISGGIYTNTTWTAANSPYIVTDTVVVFPGVTLTIEPGVVVQFDSAIDLEIRQATLIATGNSTDSITFTSSSGTPVAGIWKGIYFNDPVAISIDYCIFKYAFKAVNLKPWINPLLTVTHSSFYYNTTCITQNFNFTTIKQCTFYNNGSCLNGAVQGIIIDSCYFFNNTMAEFNNDKATITNCTFTNNQTGIYPQNNEGVIKNCNFCNSVRAITGGIDTLTDCTFLNNHQALVRGTYVRGNIFSENDTALTNLFIDSSTYFFNNSIFNNHVGIIFGGSSSSYNSIHMYNNNVCHNTVYNLSYTSQNNVALQGVCWCDTDSTSIAAGIYDGYDNVAYGLVQFIPFVNCNDSVLPPITFSCPGNLTGINSAEMPDESFILYPNPAINSFTIKNISSRKQVLVQIINPPGQIVYTEKLFGKYETVVNANLSQGIYFVSISIGETNVVRELIVE